MRPQWKTGWMRTRGLTATTCALLAVAVVAISVWQSVQAQAPPTGVQLELVNEDEDCIERKKHGEFRARPIFNRQLSTLYTASAMQIRASG